MNDNYSNLVPGGSRIRIQIVKWNLHETMGLYTKNVVKKFVKIIKHWDSHFRISCSLFMGLFSVDLHRNNGISTKYLRNVFFNFVLQKLPMIYCTSLEICKECTL